MSNFEITITIKETREEEEESEERKNDSQRRESQSPKKTDNLSQTLLSGTHSSKKNIALDSGYGHDHDFVEILVTATMIVTPCY